MSNIYRDFLSLHNYDVRISKDARWIDQKCTFDVVSIIANCIIEYVESSGDENEEFTVSDIWKSEYSRENIIEIFSKPDPLLQARNEYDKYFGQPIKLLGYSKVLNVRKEKTRYFYSVNNMEILSKIALRERNALDFLYEYIQKVLSDSGLSPYFNEFFEEQTKDSYRKVREKFVEFTIENTNINGKTECGRIFTKIINPLAFKEKKLGTERGFISKRIITLNDLQYNRLNWRDELSGKDKTVTRSEYEPTLEQLKARAYAKYTVEKAKKAVRKFNDKMNGGYSEVLQDNETVNATQAHHIFPQSDFPDISDYVENLIMLTPNQHFSMAHPNNNTQYIDTDFQYICLIAKSSKIHSDLTSANKEKFYDFDDYKYVLGTGLSTDQFETVRFLDFAAIISTIDQFYDTTNANKYSDLIHRNTGFN